MTDIVIGHSGHEPFAIDLDRLVGAHMGVVANAGGGKSGMLRKLLEATHGSIQHIVLDSEDEFYTLRQRFDYVIAGGDEGDIPARVDNARGLALTALEHGFSLICQLNDLGRHGADEFVGAFIDAMIGAPKELWHPCLVIIDEAQRYDPASIGKLTGEGRKRGFTGVVATQRFPKLDPNIRGDINNWVMGRVGQNLDRRHVADQLGMTRSEQAGLVQLQPRHFYAMGPALALEATKFRVDDVETMIVKPGQAKVATPPAPEAMRAILAALAKPAPAEQQPDGSQTAAAASALSDLERAEFKALRAEAAERDRKIISLTQHVANLETDNHSLRNSLFEVGQAIDAAKLILESPPPQVAEPPVAKIAEIAKKPAPAPAPAAAATATGKPAREVARPQAGIKADSPPGLTKPMQRVLDAIAWWRALGIHPAGRNRVAIVAGFSPIASTVSVYISRMLEMQLVDTTEPGKVGLTEAGVRAANDPGKVDASTSVGFARALLKPAVARTFDVIVAAHPDWIERDAVADALNLSRVSSTTSVYISKLSSLGFIETRRGEVRAVDWLFAPRKKRL